MSVFNWIELAVSPFAAADIGKARDFAAFFRGSCQITIGTALLGFYGQRLTHIFGNEIKFVSCGAYGGLGGFLGKFINESGPLLGLVGMNGDVSVAMGPRIAITYGGPRVDIQRAPVIKKVSYKSVNRDVVSPGGGFWGLITSLTSDMASLQLAGDQPQEPTGKDAIATDKKTDRAILALSVLLNLVTASFELAIRFKYPSYDPKTEDGFSTPKILNTVVTTISNIILAVIYAIETAGTWTQFCTTFKDNAKEVLDKVLFALGCVTLVLPLYWFTEWLGKTWQEGSNLTKGVMIGIAFLVIAGLLIGLTLGMTIARK